MSIEGKKIIITGGATGYGYGDARALKAAGGEVWIVGRRLDRHLLQAPDEAEHHADEKSGEIDRLSRLGRAHGAFCVLHFFVRLFFFCVFVLRFAG